LIDDEEKTMLMKINRNGIAAEYTIKGAPPANRGKEISANRIVNAYNARTHLHGPIDIKIKR